MYISAIYIYIYYNKMDICAASLPSKPADTFDNILNVNSYIYICNIYTAVFFILYLHDYIYI